MSEGLQQIVYFSKAIKLMSESKLNKLLEECRQRNKRSGITGMLLYIETNLYGSLEGRFIQAIEGPPTAIRETFARIAVDERHRNVTLLQERQVYKRDFADWTMGFESKHDAADEGQAVFHAQLFQQQQPSLNIPLNYLRSFYALRAL